MYNLTRLVVYFLIVSELLNVSIRASVNNYFICW